MILNIDNINAYNSVYIAKDMDTKYGVSEWNVGCHFSIKDEQPYVLFRVYPRAFANWKECLFECDSYKELKQWLEDHKEEIK